MKLRYLSSTFGFKTLNLFKTPEKKASYPNTCNLLFSCINYDFVVLLIVEKTQMCFVSEHMKDTNALTCVFYTLLPETDYSENETLISAWVGRSLALAWPSNKHAL